MVILQNILPFSHFFPTMTIFSLFIRNFTPKFKIVDWKID